MQQFIAPQGDISGVSIGVLHALDHAYFVGVMTNVLFGAILLTPRIVWPWADHVIFWGLSVGAVAFIDVQWSRGRAKARGRSPTRWPSSRRSWVSPRCSVSPRT